MFNYNNELRDTIQKEFQKNELHPILWRGIVVEIDFDGKRFPQKIKGSLKVRVPGLHNYIDQTDEIDTLPIVIPFFNEAGFVPSIPQQGDQVFIIFEYLEPIGQGYWLTLIPGTVQQRQQEKSLAQIYRDIFGI